MTGFLEVSGTPDVDGTRTFIRVIGELDMATAPMLVQGLARILAESRAAEVVIDLREVGFMGAAGIRALLEARDDCSRRSVLLRVVADHRAVIRPLELTGQDTGLALSYDIDGLSPCRPEF